MARPFKQRLQYFLLDVDIFDDEKKMPEEHKLPNEFMFCFYWIEVGYATIEDRTMTLKSL